MKNPEIRFIDDNIDWQNENLSDALIERNTTSYKNNGLEHVSLTKDGVIPKSDRYERDFLVTTKNKKYKITKINDICYNPANMKFGVICRNKYKDGIFSPIYITFETTEKYSPNFVELLVTNPKFIRASLKYQEGTVYERMAVSPDNLLKMPISIPNIELQNKISKIFEDIDIKIKEETGLIQKLKDTKSALLIKMFPQENQSVPELRFDGFTNDWEQRKLGETVNFYSGLTYSPNNVVEKDGTLVLRSSNVQNGEIALNDNVYVENKVVNSLNVSKGDIIVVVRNGSRALIGKHAQIKEKMDNTVIGAFMTGIRSDFPSYINALLSTSKFDEEIEKNLGATINQITTGAFKEMNFAISTNSDEKKKIGIFFETLDNLITLHQRKCDKLKQIKSALLDKLLV